jgi:hypothetical protein
MLNQTALFPLNLWPLPLADLSAGGQTWANNWALPPFLLRPLLFLFPWPCLATFHVPVLASGWCPALGDGPGPHSEAGEEDGDSGGGLCEDRGKL